MAVIRYPKRKGMLAYSSPERRLAVQLMRGGYMAPAEITAVSGIPRATVHYWSRAGGFNAHHNRIEFCRKQWKELLSSGHFDN